MAFNSHAYKRLKPKSQMDLMWAALWGGFQTWTQQLLGHFSSDWLQSYTFANYIAQGMSL